MTHDGLGAITGPHNISYHGAPVRALLAIAKGRPENVTPAEWGEWCTLWARDELNALGIGEERACQKCGTTFVTGIDRRADALYCSNACARAAAQKAYRDRQRENA